MMTFGGGWFGVLGPLMMVALLVGVALIVIWAAQGGARGGEDDALTPARLFESWSNDARRIGRIATPSPIAKPRTT